MALGAPLTRKFGRKPILILGYFFAGALMLCFIGVPTSKQNLFSNIFLTLKLLESHFDSNCNFLKIYYFLILNFKHFLLLMFYFTL